MVDEESTVDNFPIPPVVIEHFKKLSPHFATIEDILQVTLDSSEDENKIGAWLHPGSAMAQKINCLDSYFKIKSPSQKPTKHKTEHESNPLTSGRESPKTPTVLHSISDEADTSDSTSDSSEKIPVASHNVAKSTTAHSQSPAKKSEHGTVVEDCNKSQSNNSSDKNETALSKMQSPSHSDSFRVKDSPSDKSKLIESLLLNAANKLTPKSLTSNFQKNQIVSSTPKLHSTPGEVQDETLGSTFQSTGLETDLNSTLLGTSALDKINFDDPTTCKGIVFSEDLKEDDEIYIVQCPKELDVGLLKGKRISLKGESGLQLQAGDSIQKYEALASEETLQRNVNLILPSQTTRTFKLVTLPLAGSILLTEDAEIPTIEEEGEEPHLHEKSKIALPKGLKERHPLLGRDYQAATKATPSSNFMLSMVKTEKVSKNESESNTESGDNAKKKKKKKTKTDPISMERTELKSPKKEVSEALAHQKTIPEPTPIVKKKKKSKHSFYDQLVVQNLTASLNLELSQIKSDKSEQLNAESKDKKKKKKKKKKKAEHQETEPETPPPTKKKKKSKHFIDQHTVKNLTNSLNAELLLMKSENVEKNVSEVSNPEHRDKEKKKKKKKKEKADAEPGPAPTKKKKKSKHSFDQQSIKDLTKGLMLEVPKVKNENDANGNEFVNTEPRHKSKKKKRKADFDDSQTASFHDDNQSDFTPKKKKRKHMSEEI